MKKIARQELLEAVRERKEGSTITMTECILENMDLSGLRLRDIDFEWSDFRDVNFNGADLSGCSFRNVYFTHTTMENTVLKRVDFSGANMRRINLRNAYIGGANLFCAVLEGAVLEGVLDDETTKYFRMHCPESGPILGYKKCFNYRIVQLLIPADAKRASATNNACRCSKAKVLTIKSFDLKDSFTEARSLVDENFVYRVGETNEVLDFDEDRWNESTTGIHFWLTREEALAY